MHNTLGFNTRSKFTKQGEKIMIELTMFDVWGFGLIGIYLTYKVIKENKEKKQWCGQIR